MEMYLYTLVYENHTQFVCISLVIREFFSFQNYPQNLDPSCKTNLDLGLFRKGKIDIILKFRRTDLVILVILERGNPVL